MMKKSAAILLALMIGCAALNGCATPITRHPLPDELRDRAVIPGMPPGIRAWGDQYSPEFQKSILESFRQAQATWGSNAPNDVLALSGGGSHGAFGAGLLVGWTASGHRPRFRMVTGISVGAILAPFAFLGSDYDRQLTELGTTISANDIFVPRSLLVALGSDSLADTTPLRHLLDHYIDEPVLRAVAAEHAKGRRLFVGTTNLDAQRPVIWDMGAIASSKSPHALELFREVILASASVPAYFPPVFFQVVADGKTYDEMHVDGGASDQIILYGDTISPRQIFTDLHLAVPNPPANVYIILNAKLVPQSANVEPRVLSIADAAITTLKQSQRLGNLYRLYAVARRDGLVFNLAYIPDDFMDGGSDSFDKKAMARLFDRGRTMGQAGYAAQQEPPGLIRREPIAGSLSPLLPQGPEGPATHPAP